MDDNQALALTPATLSAPDLSSLPAWQRRIVALIQRGIPIRDAAEQQRVSWASIDAWTRSSSAFAEAVAIAEAGVAIAGRDSLRSLAVAHAEDMVLDAVAESRGRDPETGLKAPDIRASDRVANRRVVLEVAGAVGQGAQAPVRAQGIVINITVRPTGDLLPSRVIVEGEAEGTPG